MKKIDNGKPFDWGRTSVDYAQYRDIYPKEMYQTLINKGVCVTGQKVLDIGTGTGVVPRNLYPFGADFTGIDISANQIAQARLLAEKSGMSIAFYCMPAEQSDFPHAFFDIVTACQCFTYFNHAQLAPHLRDLLKAGGKFIVLYMAWLPFEDMIAGKSEELILKYNPMWTGCNEKRHPISMPDVYSRYFTLESQDLFDAQVPFTRESWNGRIRTCRGIGASLPDKDVEKFDAEHRSLLDTIAPAEFTILHYVAITTMKSREQR